MYAYYTSDKELGGETGHVVNLDLSTVLKQAESLGDSRILLDFRAMGIHYRYPDFVLLGSRASLFLELGLTWEM